jgi:predicted metal-dependent phosphoesterase TrpH
MADVDLHMHTTRSDGRLTPTELVGLLVRNQVKVASITDHDTTAGLEEAMEAAAAHPDLRLIPGVEISCDMPGGEIHILAYFVDTTDQELQATLARFRQGRLERGVGMVEKLTEMGMPLSWERVLEIAGDASVGRPHVAQALIEKGYVQTNTEAFDKYLGRNSPAYVEREKLTPAEAIGLALGNGAMPVLAHPGYVNDLEKTLPGLKAAGLAGMEVYYSKYPPKQVRELARLAEQHELVPCGGSDYHAFGYDDEPLPGAAGPPLSSVTLLEERKAAHDKGTAGPSR